MRERHAHTHTHTHAHTCTHTCPLHPSSYMMLGMALRHVLDALRKQPMGKMFLFGLAALDKFKGKLKDYAQYCSAIANVPHFSQIPSSLQQVGVQSTTSPHSTSLQHTTHLTTAHHTPHYSTPHLTTAHHTSLPHTSHTSHTTPHIPHTSLLPHKDHGSHCSPLLQYVEYGRHSMLPPSVAGPSSHFGGEVTPVSCSSL